MFFLLFSVVLLMQWPMQKSTETYLCGDHGFMVVSTMKPDLMLLYLFMFTSISVVLVISLTKKTSVGTMKPFYKLFRTVHVHQYFLLYYMTKSPDQCKWIFSSSSRAKDSHTSPTLTHAGPSRMMVDWHLNIGNYKLILLFTCVQVFLPCLMILFHPVHVFCPIRIWAIPYVYGISCTCMGIFPIPYAYWAPYAYRTV